MRRHSAWTWIVLAACWLVIGSCTPAAGGPDRDGAGCSAIALDAGGTTVFGANLDYRYHCRGQVFINPRGLHKTGVDPGTTGVNAEWVSEFASVTFNFVGYQIAWAGMNEAGLVMSTMSLYETEIPPRDQRPTLDSGFWMQYLLDTCETVDEVLAADADVRNLTVDHYLVADRAGNAATIEFLDGELVAHTGDDLPVSVLTNTAYSEVLSVWQMVGGRSDYSWLDGSAQRFCLAADRVSEFAGDDAADGIEFAFDTLDVVAGQRFSEHTSQWSLVFDTGDLRAYFRTHLDPTLRWIDLDDRFLWCNRPVQMLDIHAPAAGDAGPMLHDFSHAEARDQLLWFIDFWWGVDATPAGITAFLNHCEDFACGRPTTRRPGHRMRPVGK